MYVFEVDNSKKGYRRKALGMIRGAQKQMIVVKTADSKVFEEAYFVLRRDRSCDGSDILSEAGRIIEACGEGTKKKSNFELKSYILYFGSFVCGGALGGILVGLIMFFA
jgi:hypothetical protein